MGHHPRHAARDGRRDGDRAAAGTRRLDRLRLLLLVEDRIEVQLHAGHDRLWVRVAAQVYNQPSDIERLADAVLRRTA